MVLFPEFLEALVGSHTVCDSLSVIQITSTNAPSLMSFPAGRPATEHAVLMCAGCNKNSPQVLWDNMLNKCF